MLLGDRRQVLLADVEPRQQRQGDRAPGLVLDEQPQDDEDMAVDEGRAGRAGGRVVMHAGPLDVRPEPLRRGVVQGEGQPRGPGQQGPDHLDEEAPGDVIGPLAGGGDGEVAGLVLAAELGGPDPTGDGPPAPGQDGPEEQEGEPRGGAAVEGGGEPGEPLARGGCGMRGCHRGPAPLGVSGWCGNRHRPGRAGPRRAVDDDPAGPSRWKNSSSNS